MIPKNLEAELNEQIKYELFSAYYYLAMAAYLEDADLPGAANFFKMQGNEEVEHAMKFFNYINERGGRVELEAIDKPEKDFESLQQIFELSLEHEQFVTGRINKLVDISIQENDHATKSFLNWFVDEQVEEEATMNEYLAKAKMVGDSGNGLLMLDKELGSRED